MFALEAYATAANAPATGDGGFQNLIFMMLVVFAIFYFILIRPESRKRKLHEQMIQGLNKGDRVLTASGIYGTVVGKKEKENIVVLKIAENTKVEMLASAVSQKIVEETKSK